MSGKCFLTMTGYVISMISKWNYGFSFVKGTKSEILLE